ncbi:N-acetylglucosaminyl deacetylase, LmbE family [Saccharicrinis carchari]|uniref:N-acetylglucosaminyl deacetylase, LmbE family n=1 Tax=Saccharicrinis carchari TaxID=1168039 RepID=A0A521BTQ5_SACCC|nr:PIG-L deacetylase family protein [Saccharicrinis carchari]SMO50539.1 N-acetylglucosaminyl deacetylase, LmbE family [Saccharicrinis carchari]
MKKNILILAPHPDDEVLGCGGFIKKKSQQGHRVYVLVATRGSAKRYSEERVANVRREALDAHALLGVSETVFLDFPAPDLDLVSKADMSGEIAHVLKKFEIEELFLPHRGDIHHDHQAVFNAGLVAARPVHGNTVKRIYAYETLSETEWAAPFAADVFIPNYFEEVSDTFAAKLEAMKLFKSQLREFPNSRSLQAIEALAKFRGCTVGFDRAEAFMVIRVIES